MRLTFSSVQNQAIKAGHLVEKLSSGYLVDGRKFRVLAEVVNFLNSCYEAAVRPELTIIETQQVAAQMGFMVLVADGGYEIFYEEQLLGNAHLLAEVLEVLPQYKEAIARYHEIEKLEAAVAAPEIQVLEQHGDEFVVANLENGNYYVVRPSHPVANQRCECADCYYRARECKHQKQVEKYMESATEAELTGIEKQGAIDREVKVLFLDCDGTIREPKSGAKFISSPDDQQPIAGAEQAIEEWRWKDSSCKVFGITNQGGVAAGHKSLEDAIAEQRITLELFPQIEAIYMAIDYGGKICIEVRRDVKYRHKTIEMWSSFRKPGWGMIELIVVQLWNQGFDWNQHESLMVGDRPEDAECAHSAGIPFQEAWEWRVQNKEIDIDEIWEDWQKEKEKEKYVHPIYWDGCLAFRFTGDSRNLASVAQYKESDRCSGSIFEALIVGDRIQLAEGIFELDEYLDLIESP